MSATVTRRLSARRGSTTAPDPYAKNAHLIRESSSILTIVRVSSPPATTPSTPALETPPSPRRAHRRIGSNPNTPLPSPGSPDPPSARLSFAFSSFGAPHQQASPGGGPTPRPRPASPHRAGSASSFSKPRLSPEQLLEVAKQATNPRYVPSPAVTPSIASHSPVIHPRASSPLGQQSPTVAPATFTPLPHDVYLPFLDRPAEVSALLSSPPSAKLFALLAQTFPKNKARDTEDDGALPHNTADWTFAHLAHWLTQTTRDEASDAFWVQTARRCILLHSELIWERLKGALGVPPELDVEYTEAEYHDVFESDEESGDEQGRWGNWGSNNAVLDSPVFDRTSSPSASRNSSTTVEPSMSRTPTTDTSSSTPTLVTQLPTPAHDEYFTFSPSELAPSGSEIFIEPILASDQAILGPHPPPLSLPGDASSLGDIGEEEEDEDAASPPVGATPAAAEVPEPPQVHGLRISTPGTPLLPNAIRSATTGAPMRSPSFSARAPPHSHSPTFRSSSSSSGSLRLERSASFGSARSVGSSNSGYDPVADRAPGNPLFPSNFARLALGPTLAANNPALRSPSLPPQSRFSMGRRSSSTRSEQRGNRFHRGAGAGEEEPHYAATFASSSSAGSVRDA
ncbi:hypothetical protein C8F04DRAFT_1399284 [Mycena alexandri]|uniref:Uncharacterized protein n=1 Tax=Mycena alexandri TaxID=1745969 RepID=A0AAD6WYC9_9AGAR|nr:hypothetical protein C8F04DRAFT_1399284 [Mycena alexandri]